jgi:hypothetical protein
VLTGRKEKANDVDKRSGKRKGGSADNAPTTSDAPDEPTTDNSDQKAKKGKERKDRKKPQDRLKESTAASQHHSEAQDANRTPKRTAWDKVLAKVTRHKKSAAKEAASERTYGLCATVPASNELPPCAPPNTPTQSFME